MSTQVTTELIKELRDSTGISLMQCRNALTLAEGDMKKALAILKKASSDIALKKVNRMAKDGAVMIKVGDLPAPAGKKAVLVSLHCETDFVSRNEDFGRLLKNLADKAFSLGIEKTKKEAKEMIDLIIQKTGENIQLGEIYEIKGSVLGGYVHNNKIAVLVSLLSGNAELARDIAMHIAAMKPEGIPELLEQPFIKNLDETVGKLLQKNHAKIKEMKHYSIQI